jgi:hypothetical protein
LSAELTRAGPRNRTDATYAEEVVRMSRWLLLPLLVLPVLAGTASGAQRDRDHDRLPDRWEKRYHLSTKKKSGKGDADRDGLRNRREYRLRTNPRKKDSDGDGLRDGAEVHRHQTNPRRKDSDGDGFSDRDEIRAATDPTDAASHPPGSPSLPAPTPTPMPAPVPPPRSCDLNATPTNFASQVSVATSGQMICLATGNYGTWSGTNKSITVGKADGASPTMKVNFGAGDSGFALDGMTGMGGSIDNGATRVTIRNSAFTSPIDIGGAGTDGIVLDANTHNWNVGPSTSGPNAKIYLESSLTGTLASPSVTVQSSEMSNGDLDGIHFGGGSGFQILGNRLTNLCDMGANHTDNMQFDTSTTTAVRIVRNYVYAPAGCSTQGITSYDAGTSGVIIEDNVVDIRRPWGIELYADRNSIVRHNTVRWHPDTGCMFSGIECGQIDINRKSTDPAGSGTQIYDNLTTRVNFVGGSTGTAHHNTNPATVSYVGPLTSWVGFRLAPGSLGTGAASDGLDAGIRVP